MGATFILWGFNSPHLAIVCHSREGGNPVSDLDFLDTRLRGCDDLENR
jgi:hypothetical protein